VREIQNAYYSAMSPFLKSGSKLETRARAFLEETRHSKELEAELEATREQLGRLRLIESRFRELEYENAQLRHALDFKKATRFDVVAARVIRRNPTTWWQTVEIDAGSKRGIGTQLAVLSNEGLVGKIDRVDSGGERSSVLLLTDEKCQVSARVEGSPEVGILSGQRGGFDGDPMLRLRFLSPNAAVRPGPARLHHRPRRHLPAQHPSWNHPLRRKRRAGFRSPRPTLGELRGSRRGLRGPVRRLLKPRDPLFHHHDPAPARRLRGAAVPAGVHRMHHSRILLVQLVFLCCAVTVGQPTMLLLAFIGGFFWDAQCALGPHGGIRRFTPSRSKPALRLFDPAVRRHGIPDAGHPAAFQTGQVAVLRAALRHRRVALSRGGIRHHQLRPRRVRALSRATMMQMAFTALLTMLFSPLVFWMLFASQRLCDHSINPEAGKRRRRNR
jgi:hypothetical protein